MAGSHAKYMFTFKKLPSYFPKWLYSPNLLKNKSIGTLCYREARDHLLLTCGKQGQRDCDLCNITQDDSGSVWARQQSCGSQSSTLLSNNSLGRLNLLLPLSRTIMDSSAKEITSVLPDFTLSAPLRLPCCSDMILAQFQVAGVNLFRRFLMQTKFRAFILLD